MSSRSSSPSRRPAPTRPASGRRTSRYEPAEIAAEAAASAAAGAAVIHIHVRDAEGRPTMDLGRYRETVAAVREPRPSC